MKVLLIEFDLFREMGGGQTVYRRLVETCPDLEFHYFTKQESEGAPRPANAHPIPFQEPYAFQRLAARVDDVGHSLWQLHHFVEASNIAASVRNRHFDVVDFPDYTQRGMFLRPAFRRHGVRFDRLVLALHGTCSVSEAMNWQTLGMPRVDLDLYEQWQYHGADVRYAISRDYLEEWRDYGGIAARYLHPLRFLDLPRPRAASGDGAPDLHFIGRTERRKGPDTFVDLAGWMPREAYGRARILGPEGGAGAGATLAAMAAHRGLDITMSGGRSPAELAQLYASRSLTVLPSRWDSLNLLALDSLFSGCPTAIGSGAGVVRFLREAYPGLPFVRIDMGDPRSCIPELVALLQNYDAHREALVEAIEGAEPSVEGEGLREIYAAPPLRFGELDDHHDGVYVRLLRLHNHPMAANIAQDGAQVSRVPNPDEVQLLREADRQLQAPGEVSPKAHFYAQVSRALWDVYPKLQCMPEATDRDIAAKLAQLWELAECGPVDRIRWWREIARLERMRGHDLIAATYALRNIRLQGYDAFGDLAFVARTLEAQGYPEVAVTARAMFGPEGQREAACRRLLDEAFERHRRPAPLPEPILDDRRSREGYRVSIIVSLYDAASKLPLFLRTLKDQTLLRRGEAEVILVETGSPADDYGAFRRAMEAHPLEAVYARTEARETIQSAWNRGIALARAPYLTFLGVDEAVVPCGLERLAAELDADPAVDWVQADSLVTEVDAHGQWRKDLMRYHRGGYHQDLVYLETCYLSWVGALYRRSLHDRFGFYDPTFRAAGDTEFKGRVLPRIRSKAVPGTLGYFLDYPGGSTTQSPCAELEDLRAWYLHRSRAGIGYAFDARPVEEVEAQFRRALSYRKSFLQEPSTDVEYALELGTYLSERDPGSRLGALLPGLSHLLQAMRGIEYFPGLYNTVFALDVLRAYGTARDAARAFAAHGWGDTPPLALFNDNRYEQHSMLWRTDPQAFPNRREGPTVPRYAWAPGPVSERATASSSSS